MEPKVGIRFPKEKEKILFATASQSLGQTGAPWERSMELRQKVFYPLRQLRIGNCLRNPGLDSPIIRTILHIFGYAPHCLGLMGQLCL